MGRMQCTSQSVTSHSLHLVHSPTTPPHSSTSTSRTRTKISLIPPIPTDHRSENEATTTTLSIAPVMTSNTISRHLHPRNAVLVSTHGGLASIENSRCLSNNYRHSNHSSITHGPITFHYYRRWLLLIDHVALPFLLISSSGGATALDILSDNQIWVARDLGLSIDGDGFEWH